MSLLDNIKADQLTARKAKEATKASLLTTLMGDIQNALKGSFKGTEDEVVLSTVKKYLDANKEFQGKDPDSVTLAMLQLEQAVLESYMPLQLSKQEILTIIKDQNLVDLPSIMKHFKSNYLGRYDGKTLSDLARASING